MRVYDGYLNMSRILNAMTGTVFGRSTHARDLYSEQSVS